MKKVLLTSIVLVLACIGCRDAALPEQQGLRELIVEREARRYFGVHYDTHVQKGWRDFGETTDPARVARMLDEVRPDYIQISCKGHPGYAVYPTKIQEGPETMARDMLRIWRDETKTRNVELYMHFSGVLDDWVLKKHPDWAALDADGKPYAPDNIFFSPTSIFSPYADTYFIPQLKELIDDYRVDGVWIDGDCWGMTWDYSGMSLKKFREQTGATRIPGAFDDPGFPEFARFCRSEYREYAAHYIKELHEYAPDFKVLNSGAYSARMPEFGDLDLDYLSVDEPTTLVRRGGMPFREPSTINFCRFDGRVFANQSIPWDLMVWGFYRRNFRTAAQLKQDAAVIHAMGGGALMYFPQKHSGGIPDESIPILAEVAEFSRARQPYCYLAKSIPQIGLIMPSESTYRLLKRPFELDDEGELQFFKGLLFGLVEARQVVDIVLMDPGFRVDPNDYPLMVLANWEFLLEEQQTALLDYVASGGNLLIVGPHTAGHFREVLDFEWEGEIMERSNGIPVGDQVADIIALSGIAEPGPDAESLLDFYPDFNYVIFQTDDYDSYREAGAIAVKHGQGRIAACFIDLGTDYYSFRSVYTRKILGSLVKELFPEPMVEVSGSEYVDVTLNRLDGQTALHLVNTSGPHAQKDVYIYHDIPVVGPLDIRIRLERKPAGLVLQPSGKDIRFDYRDGIASFTLDRLEIHDIVIINE